MPGRWQVAILHVLAQQSPLALQAIQARCGATTRTQRSACKRAVRMLLQSGLVVRPRRGVYALVIYVEVLIRTLWPTTEIGRVKPRKETVCPGP